MLTAILNAQTAALAASVESLLAIKFLPEHFESQYGHLTIILSIFAFNYGVLGVYHLLVYPLLLNPLRRLSGPKVSLHPP
jgi:hypothetical protein